MTALAKTLSISALLCVAILASPAQQTPGSARKHVLATRSQIPTQEVAAPPMPATGLVLQAPLSPLSTTMTAGPVQIGPGDLLEIGVFDTPELAGKVRVNSQGKITLPLIGVVHAGGLSPEQAQDLVASLLKERDFVKNPQVSVFVAEYASQSVYVMGEVMRPGPYPFMGSHRLLDFIAAAGGFTPRAGKTVVLTALVDPERPRTFELGSPGKDSNPELATGDSVIISQAGIVYVLGDVRRPGGFMLNKDDALTLMQALALAEGILPTAAKSSARLIRTTAKGREEVPVNLNAIAKSKTADLAMQANDILIVPGSTTKGVLKGIASVLPAAASSSIYRIP
jgi:polysaccharide biosynthesis/export protein